jgi:hypothetical protein
MLSSGSELLWCTATEVPSLEAPPSSWCSDPLPPYPVPFLHYTLRASYRSHTTMRLLSRLGSCLGYIPGYLTLHAFSCAGAQGVQSKRLAAFPLRTLPIKPTQAHPHSTRMQRPLDETRQQKHVPRLTHPGPRCAHTEERPLPHPAATASPSIRQLAN